MNQIFKSGHLPIFIDNHSAKGMSHADLEKFINLPSDNDGVICQEMFFSKKGDRVYCIFDAPNEETVRKHHEASGFKCDFIMEVHHIKTERSIKTEKFAILGQMSSNISHDLRNPMAIIKNSIDLISVKYKDHITAGISDQLSMMDRAIFNMNAMINDILNFARTQSLHLENHSLAKIITRSISTIKIPTNIIVTLPQNDIMLKIDGAKIESVFYNIVLNAIQSIGDIKGEVIIKIIEKPGDTIQIQIQNSGPAIPDNLLIKIFEPLFTTKKLGTGLGLPSCKNIVEQHHGNIQASNNPTTFTITLPKNIEKSASVNKS